jgi:NDP-sugar pyrophosphorylase family protein
LSNISAAILTGGLGTRLQTVVSDRPKALAQVGDRPFVVYLLDQLCNFEICQAVLCTGYLGKMFESYLGKSYRNLNLAYSHEPVALGTAGALRLALPLLNTQQVLVLNGDSYCDVDLGKLISSHREWKASITIAVTLVVDSSRYGTVILNDQAEIISFKEKGEQNGAGFINAGIYVIDHSVITKIPIGKQLSLEQDVFPQYLGHSLHGFLTDGCFIDIGIPIDYERAQKLLPAISNNSFNGKQTT